MPIFHMETDSVRAMASQLKQSTETMRSQAQSLNSSNQSIDWLGPSRDEFVMEMEAVVRQLNAQAEAGGMLAGRVENEVAEWENTSLELGIVGNNPANPWKHSGEVLGAHVELPNPTQIFNVFKASLGTLILFGKNIKLEGLSVIVDSLNFFVIKMPKAEQAFQRWEEYNNRVDDFDINTAHALRADAQKALEGLGISTIKDTLDSIVVALPKTTEFQNLLDDIYKSLGAIQSWLETLKKE